MNDKQKHDVTLLCCFIGSGLCVAFFLGMFIDAWIAAFLFGIFFITSTLIVLTGMEHSN